MSKSVAILVLAAGSSTRMGQPKQLMKWGNETLLTHTLKQAIQSNAKEVFVVLGAHADRIIPHLKNLNITFLLHENWAAGLGSSLAFGIDHLKNKNYTSILLLLSDQPQVTSSYINLFLDQKSSQSTQILATSYGNNVGIPVLFPSHYFDKLIKNKQEGAKHLIAKYRDHVKVIEPTTPLEDIDTKSQYSEMYRAKWGYHPIISTY